MTLLLSLGTLSFSQQTMEQRVTELEAKLSALESDAESRAFPELSGQDLSPMYGLGAGASKVYHVPGGVSIGGYGEAVFTHRDEGTDTSDFLRAIVYLGYKFNEHWVLNTEIEFEHASTGEDGSASVEFATLDYLHRDFFNARVGLVLVPMGIVNELHEPNTFLPVGRAVTEQVILPSTWRENGIGIFGGNERVRYKAYLVNGLKAEDFGAKGLRGGRQKGSKAEAEDWAGVLRGEILLASDSSLGGSVYHGGSGQSLDVDVATTLAEAHADLNFGALKLRGLVAAADLDDVAELNRIISASESEDGIAAPDREIDSIGESMLGWYLEAGFDLFHSMDLGEQALLPFVRYEEVNTQEDVPSGFAESGTYDLDIVTIGLHYRPIDELVFKIDFVNTQSAAGADEDLVNLAFGYVF